MRGSDLPGTAAPSGGKPSAHLPAEGWSIDPRKWPGESRHQMTPGDVIVGASSDTELRRL